MPELTGAELARLMLQGAHEGLAKAALEVLEEAKRRAPKTDPEHDPDPSVTLADSGHIELEPGGRSVRIEFDTPYAAKQHEALHYRHPHGGEAKYLEKSLLEVAPRFAGILAGPVHKLFSGGRS